MSRAAATATSLRDVQATRLEAINQKLVYLQLPPLQRLGNWRNGEIEIVRFVNYQPNPYYITVEYETIGPDGKTGYYYPQYQIGSDLHPTCALIPVINETHFIMLHSHRPAALTAKHSWFTEFPRGFPVNNLRPTLLDRKLQLAIPAGQQPPACALQIAGRKLVALLKRDDVEIIEFARLDGSAEDEGLFQDPGRSGDTIAFWLMRLTTHDLERIIQEVNGPDHMRLRFISCRDIRTIKAQRQHHICNLIDRSAISLWQERSNDP